MALMETKAMAQEKIPFDVHEVMVRLRVAVEPYPKAALFELADEGFTSPFEQLIACLISIRTLDEVMLVCARQLFQLARTPEQMVNLAVEEIDRAISKSTFHQAKAAQIQAIAAQAVTAFGGAVPCQFEALTSFRGIGPKCANLVLGIACGQPSIGVDIHVHRVTNRWGYVQAPTPEQTMGRLEERLPREYWVEINRLLVPFGKHICTGKLPRCSTCPVEEMCRQVGVTKHR
jgi:endonuclease-3